MFCQTSLPHGERGVPLGDVLAQLGLKLFRIQLGHLRQRKNESRWGDADLL